MFISYYTYLSLTPPAPVDEIDYPEVDVKPQLMMMILFGMVLKVDMAEKTACELVGLKRMGRLFLK